ncbi:36699_t:CDS:2, partial [Racocetra persica]
TLRKWSDEGKIKHLSTPNGKGFYLVEDISRLFENYERSLNNLNEHIDIKNLYINEIEDEAIKISKIPTLENSQELPINVIEEFAITCSNEIKLLVDEIKRKRINLDQIIEILRKKREEKRIIKRKRLQSRLSARMKYLNALNDDQNN